LRIFFKLSGYKVAVINKGRKEKKALTALKNKTLKPLKSTHQRYADVFEKLGVSAKIILDTNTSVNNLSVQVQLFLQTFESKKLIGIAPFAAHTGKQYPLDKIEEVIEQILEKDKQVNILLFGGGETEKKKLDQLEKINRNRIVNVAGMFNFSEELQLISQLNLMLSMDSGNGHLAAMLNVPVVTIWGATHPYAGFAPLGQKNTQQILPDLKQFPQLPTSVYGNKIFEGFEAVWNTIPTKKVTQLVFENLQDL
jgi:ADP-heptose:LPS heptosyltransferase